jgi:hypothetical protein
MDASAPDAQFLLFRRIDGADLPATPTGRFYPLIEAGDIRLGEGEVVLWRGPAKIAEYRFTEEFDDYDLLWQLPELADVVLTSERIAFICARWAVGGGWKSGGTAPLTTMALNAASKMRAAVKRKGFVAVGHCRWEWPALIQVQPGTSITSRSRHAQQPMILLASKAPLRKGYHVVRFSGPALSSPEAVEAVANRVVQALASYRLARAEALGLDAREVGKLSELATGGAFTVAETGASQLLRLPGLLLIGVMARAEYDLPDKQWILDKKEV